MKPNSGQFQFRVEGEWKEIKKRPDVSALWLRRIEVSYAKDEAGLESKRW